MNTPPTSPLPKSLPGTPYKVPFRAVYCETRWQWIRGCICCLYRTAQKRLGILPCIVLACLAASAFAQTPLPHALGRIPEPHGIKAPPIETHPLYRAAPLPPTASVAQYFFETDQGQRGACVAFSAWEAWAADFIRDHASRMDLSPLDIYQQCLVHDGNFPQDAGTYGGTAIKILLTNGTMLEKTWPYSNSLEVLPKMTPAMTTERTAHMALKAYAIPNDDHGFASKQCIANLHIAPMIGTMWYKNGFLAKKVTCKTKDANGKTITVQRFVLPMPKGSPVGGHELTEIEYDDNMVFPGGQKGGMRIHNHWSPKGQPWGDEIGSAWGPYAWFCNPKYVEDEVAIESVKS